MTRFSALGVLLLVAGGVLAVGLSYILQRHMVGTACYLVGVAIGVTVRRGW